MEHGRRMHGYESEDDLLGRDLRVCHSDDQIANELPRFLELVRRKGAHAGEIGHARRDGTTFVTWMTATHIIDADRQLLGIVAIARDITDRKHEEAELERAKEAAEEANLAKTMFLANMSHEIRTPMNGVIGLTDLALDTDLEDEQREYITLAHSSAEALLELLNDVLDLSKIEAGQLELEETDFDLNGLLDSVLKTVAHRASEKGIDLLSEVRPGVPAALRGDPGRLRQILLNLVGNAVKFTEQGYVLVVLESEAAEEPGSILLRCSVKDTGIGIPEDHIDRVFESFSQADGSVSRRYGGTGLGLSITKMLLDEMGGEISLASREGIGSEFEFTVPFRVGQPINRLPDTEQELRPVPTLIVDDGEISRRIIRKTLEHNGFPVFEAGSGIEALAALHRLSESGERIRLILLDAQLPDMSSVQVSRQVKIDPLLGAPTILVVSSLGQYGGRADFEAAGCEGYVTKPVSTATMLAEIRRITTRQDQDQDRAGQVRKDARLGDRETAGGSRGHVLLADDNETNRLLARTILEKVGCSVEMASDGDEALKAIEAGQFDLVFMDVQMPGKDGLTATRELRRNPKYADLPIIGMTAHALEGDREKGIDAGMTEYLTKPVHKAQIHELVERWLPSGGVASPTRAPEVPERELAVFDKRAFLELVDGDMDAYRELIDAFVTSG